MQVFEASIERHDPTRSTRPQLSQTHEWACMVLRVLKSSVSTNLSSMADSQWHGLEGQ